MTYFTLPTLLITPVFRSGINAWEIITYVTSSKDHSRGNKNLAYHKPSGSSPTRRWREVA